MAKKRYIYKDGNVRVPGASSLSNILAKPELIPWAARMAVEHIAQKWKATKEYTQQYIDVVLTEAKNAHNVKKVEAGDMGSDMHEVVEAYVSHQLKPEHVVDEKTKRALENFITVTAGWKFIGSEIVVMNKELKYGGTADGIAILPSGMTVIYDIKTSKGCYPEFSMQLAMYALAKPVETKFSPYWEKIEEGRILHYNRERQTWEILEIDLKSQFPFVEHFRQCYEWRRQFSPPSLW